LRDRRAPIDGCFVCFARGAGGRGVAGERGWAGAALAVGSSIVGDAAIEGRAGSRYEAGLLALREGALLEAAVCALPRTPDVLLVNATARDHPVRPGLALHLGALLDLLTIGVTHRPLIADGDWAAEEAGARSPLQIGSDHVGWWLRTRRHARPLAVHVGWRTNLDSARAVMMAATGRVRAPEPLREARRVARRARAAMCIRDRPMRDEGSNAEHRC
jgi:deoxyribonuclease V